MIEDKDLRVGNYVLCNNKVALVKLVSSFDQALVWIGGYEDKPHVCKLSELSAIALNPQVLDICGGSPFEGECYDGEMLNISSVVWEFPSSDFKISITTCGYKMIVGSEYPFMVGTPFNSVHELQNLYHAYTGGELDINPNYL